MNGYILSYTNPDTDSLCTSIALSRYLALKGESFAVVARGNISAETKYVLDTLGITDIDTRGEYDAELPVILVDTHHLAQLPHLKSAERVVAVYDHHPAGDEFPNAKIDNRVIGAAATIVAEMILADGLMDRTLAALLGSAIISNTAYFESPSTTEEDKLIFTKLNLYYEFTPEFIGGMFGCKNDILRGTVTEIAESDVKLFEVEGITVKIAQLELVNVERSLSVSEFYDSLCRTNVLDGCAYYLLSIVDVLEKKTFVMALTERDIAFRNAVLGIEGNEAVAVFDRILLRKTDFIPQIKKLLSRA